MYKPIPDTPPKGNFLKKTPLTPAEEKFFRVLQDAVKGSRWILLRGRENLSSEPGRNGKASETERGVPRIVGGECPQLVGML